VTYQIAPVSFTQLARFELYISMCVVYPPPLAISVPPLPGERGEKKRREEMRERRRGEKGRR
jgi:hypothetical protein